MVSTSSWIFNVLALTGSTLAASSRLRDVPLGLCGICEVNCFEDCTLKFDREIIQPDRIEGSSLESSLMEVPKKVGAVHSHQGKPLDKKRMQAQKATQAELARLKSKAGKKCSKKEGCQAGRTCAANIHAELKSVAEIKEDKDAEWEKHEEEVVQDAHEFSNSGRSWADTSAMKVTINDVPEWNAPSPSALAHSHLNLAAQNATKGALRGALAPAPGLNDPNDPRTYFPLHPVKIGSFEKGIINLDMCLKYCLATTCGCEGVPGMEDKSDMGAMEEAGKEAGTHHSTPPHWKYRKAKKEECAHGLGGNKIIKDLYIDFYPGVEGWFEVCTKEFFNEAAGVEAALGMYSPEKELEKCDCGVNRLDCHEPDYGCSWNNIKNRCEYKAMHNTVCYKRYTFDDL